jgi:hypothetical protein
MRSWHFRVPRALVVLIVIMPTGAAPARSQPGEPLQFSITEGNTENRFYRHGPVAAHLVATSGRAPRLIVAFPAGNTGVGLWFDERAAPVEFAMAPGTTLDAVDRPDGMRGIAARVRSNADSLTIRSALLANIRTIRDYIAGGARTVPAEFVSDVRLGPALVFHRTTIDGRHHIELTLSPEDGTTIKQESGRLRFDAGPSGHVAFTVTALADDPPLTPFAPGARFKANVAPRPRDQDVFAFLASAEKFAAGSWRFLTYFGRDTLLTLQLLLPVLQPAVIEGALGSVLERLGPEGEVAHEEAIGEFAVVENSRLQPPPADLTAPVLDYKMIDGEFLLPCAAAAYLLDTSEGRTRAAEFLSKTASQDEHYSARLRRNLALVLARTAAFVERPAVENLLELKPGLPVGNWRDSEHGLGGGRYPFDVNVALAPAALRAAARLYRSGVLGVDLADRERAAQAEHAAEEWAKAEAFFRVTIPADEARQRVDAYARSLQLDPAAAVRSIEAPVRFHAVAIDASGQPVPVMHSDSGFVLFFTDPAPAFLDLVAREILRPFPAGLRTAVGLVVANPVFGDDHVRRVFTRADYHGTVVWSWQQALLAAGLARQLARDDLPSATRSRLMSAERTLWQLIAELEPQSTGELWSWEPRNGREALAPYGQAEGHADESNAAQLWSTIYLAVRPPRG